MAAERRLSRRFRKYGPVFWRVGFSRGCPRGPGLQPELQPIGVKTSRVRWEIRASEAPSPSINTSDEVGSDGGTSVRLSMPAKVRHGDNSAKWTAERVVDVLVPHERIFRKPRLSPGMLHTAFRGGSCFRRVRGGIGLPSDLDNAPFEDQMEGSIGVRLLDCGSQRPAG